MIKIVAFQKKIMKPWGYEILLSPPESPVVAKILHLNPCCQFSLQYHEEKEETLILVRGEAKLILGGIKEGGELKEEMMVKDSGYFIPKELVHRCFGITECDIFESSTLETGTTVRLKDDYNRINEAEEERNKDRIKN